MHINNDSEGIAKDAKLVDLSPGKEFTANGKKYKVSSNFTIGRLEQVVLLEDELELMGKQSSCHKIMLQACELINNYKPGDAYALLINKVEADKRASKFLHPAVRICAAYINGEDEDLRYLSEQTITDKIHDWAEEGLDIRPFLVLAKSISGELSEDFDKRTQDILQQSKSIKETLDLA